MTTERRGIVNDADLPPEPWTAQDRAVWRVGYETGYRVRHRMAERQALEGRPWVDGFFVGLLTAGAGVLLANVVFGVIT